MKINTGFFTKFFYQDFLLGNFIMKISKYHFYDFF